MSLQVAHRADIIHAHQPAVACDIGSKYSCQSSLNPISGHDLHPLYDFARRQRRLIQVLAVCKQHIPGETNVNWV
jgi:hypothetical protein